jgi:hypothetical protein
LGAWTSCYRWQGSHSRFKSEATSPHLQGIKEKLRQEPASGNSRNHDVEGKQQISRKANSNQVQEDFYFLRRVGNQLLHLRMLWLTGWDHIVPCDHMVTTASSVWLQFLGT